MTAKEFVKSKYPNAITKLYKPNPPFNSRYYVCWGDYRSPNPNKLSEGETSVEAWANARAAITKATTPGSEPVK